MAEMSRWRSLLVSRTAAVKAAGAEEEGTAPGTVIAATVIVTEVTETGGTAAIDAETATGTDPAAETARAETLTGTDPALAPAVAIDREAASVMAETATDLDLVVVTVRTETAREAATVRTEIATDVGTRIAARTRTLTEIATESATAKPETDPETVITRRGTLDSGTKVAVPLSDCVSSHLLDLPLCTL